MRDDLRVAGMLCSGCERCALAVVAILLGVG
jgi:hypothetical protein